jgi:hypothetical protein
MDTDLRIPVTAEQKRLISAAVAGDPRGLAAWARDVLLDAAIDGIGRQSTTRQISEDGYQFLPLQVVVVNGVALDRSGHVALPAGFLQFTIEPPNRRLDERDGAENHSAGFLAAPQVSAAASVDVAAETLSPGRPVIGIVAPGQISPSEAAPVSWFDFGGGRRASRREPDL